MTVKKRLELLVDTQKKVNNGEIPFDVDKPNFGFKRMEQLFPVVRDEIKGYPCVAYNKFNDPIKFGVKVIPLELKYESSSHPCRIELALLKEFTSLVRSGVTPHIAYFFKELSVPNKKKVLTRFPLKSLRKEIFKKSNVLIAEYVPGGSIEEWHQEQPNITEKQWKYIIFSVAWTLLCLQDSYKFLHNDFHYGNILIDTSIDPSDKSYIQYVLQGCGGSDEPLVFNIQNVGLLPKLWDFEFASTYGDDFTLKNNFFKQTEENIPHDFNPYYDLHCFLTSLLELDIPDKLRDLILHLYPEEVLPPVESDDDENTDDGESVSVDSDLCSGCSECEQPEEYYRTDETTMSSLSSSAASTTSVASTTVASTASSYSRGRKRRRLDTEDETSYDGRSSGIDGDDDMTSHCQCERCCPSYSRSRSSRSSRSWSSYESEDSRIRTEYMLGDRMLNGTEKIFRIPTPLDIITNEYFAEYRKPMSKKAKTDCVFTYTQKKPQ